MAVRLHPLVLLVLIGCDGNPRPAPKPQQLPSSVVVYDGLLQRELVRMPLGADHEHEDAKYSVGGCRLLYLEEHVVINCDDDPAGTVAMFEKSAAGRGTKRVAVRFACGAHPRSEPLGMMIDRADYTVWCE